MAISVPAWLIIYSYQRARGRTSEPLFAYLLPRFTITVIAILFFVYPSGTRGGPEH